MNQNVKVLNLINLLQKKILNYTSRYESKCYSRPPHQLVYDHM